MIKSLRTFLGRKKEARKCEMRMKNPQFRIKLKSNGMGGVHVHRKNAILSKIFGLFRSLIAYTSICWKNIHAIYGWVVDIKMQKLQNAGWD
jgi:hypothetical protein